MILLFFIPSINEGILAIASEKNEGIFSNLSSFLQGAIAQRHRLGDGRKAAESFSMGIYSKYRQ